VWCYGAVQLWYSVALTGAWRGCLGPGVQLIQNSGLDNINSICDTFENTPLREEFCDGICTTVRIPNTPLTQFTVKSFLVTNKQCVTCRGMCIDHLIAEDIVAPATPDYSRVCAFCRDFLDKTNDPESIYQNSGSLHFHTADTSSTSGEGSTGRCEQYRSTCAELMCPQCITFASCPVCENSCQSEECLAVCPGGSACDGTCTACPLIWNPDERPECASLQPSCDSYLFDDLQATCSMSVLPSLGGCKPMDIGDGVCDASPANPLKWPPPSSAHPNDETGCNTAACGFDGGDCCAHNLNRLGMPACENSEGDAGAVQLDERQRPQPPIWAGVLGDGSCEDSCWNEFCLQDGGVNASGAILDAGGGDCAFCSEECMTPSCAQCSSDCRSVECQAVCPGHSACSGECTACPLERLCISPDTVPEHRADFVASLPHCYPQKIGDGVCDPECNIDSCNNDGGDCGNCPAACVLRGGDGVCDEDCFEICSSELVDCPECSPGCTTIFEVGNGMCQPECYSYECQFDDGDCYYCGADCVSKLGDGHCDVECYIGACELDGGDCNICNDETGTCTTSARSVQRAFAAAQPAH
jgi:hypothetical protein